MTDFTGGYDWLVTSALYATPLTPLGERILVRDDAYERAVVLMVTFDATGATVYANGEYVDFGDDLPAILGIFDEVVDAIETGVPDIGEIQLSDPNC